jgi:hypothetical protein
MQGSQAGCRRAEPTVCLGSFLSPSSPTRSLPLYPNSTHKNIANKITDEVCSCIFNATDTNKAIALIPELSHNNLIIHNHRQ